MCHKVVTDEMILQLIEVVKQQISKSRFEHTLGVLTTAKYIGISLEVENLNKICAAALLHDITKEYSFSKQLKMCDEFGIILREDENSSPAVLHAITAAAVIPLEYPNFNDKEIISCVRWHTTGKINMSLSEKIIYLSDYIEPMRTHEACTTLRKTFFDAFDSSSIQTEKLKHLDNAVAIALDQTINYLNSKNAQINIDTLKALSYIKSNGI